MLAVLGYQVFYYTPKMKDHQEQIRFEDARRAAIVDSLTRIAAAEERAREQELPKTTLVPPTMLDAELTTPTGSAISTDLPRTGLGSTRYITVTTPLYEITLSSGGGEIVSIRLLNYETDDEPVQMINWDPDSLSGLGTVALVGENRRLGTSDVRFAPYLPGSSIPLADGAALDLDPSSAPKTLIFRSEGADGKQLERYYTFYADRYVFDTGIRFQAGHFPFARSIRWGFGPGLRATEANEQDDFSRFRGIVRLGEEVYKKKRGDFVEEFAGTIQWATLQTKYFTAIMMPPEPVGGEAQLRGRKAINFITGWIQIPISSRGTIDQSIQIYLGPLDNNRLSALGRGLDKTIDIGFERVAIFRPISFAILWSMQKIHKVIPNYGLVIIIISIFTKILFYRLTHKSFKSMRDMQSLQPRIAAIKERYKDDKQKQSKETMRLYKESGINPLGGCLPMVFQMPVFIALFNVLRTTIEVRGAPFMLWIDDLSQQDVLFDLPFAIPFLGTAVSVLPILMGVGMLLQSKIGGGMAGPGMGAGQPKGFTYLMPIMFTFLFYKMPSGLVIYWIVNTVLSVAQQWYINKGATDGGSSDEKAQLEQKGDDGPDTVKAVPVKTHSKSRKRKASRSKKG